MTFEVVVVSPLVIECREAAKKQEDEEDEHSILALRSFDKTV